MKKLFVLSLMLAAAVNSYALSLIFKTPREIKQGELAIIGLSADLEKIKRFNLIDENFEKSLNHSKIFAFQAGIYIPAGSRHQGLSRFDVLPFTDRRRGDPDRYRAVNPNYVKKENGNYYFVLSVKPDTHYFDENLGDKGVLPAGSVEIDLTKTKTAKTGDDKTRKYIYVKDKGYVPSDALTSKPGEIKDGRWFRFPVKNGEHQLYDGTGIARGKLAADSVKLNYGQVKDINRETYYYAFSTKIIANDSKETIGASGWIKASAIAAGNAPQYDSAFVKKMQMPTKAGDTFTRYEITGGNPQEIIGKDENGKTKYKFGYADEKNGEFVAYKVLPKVPLDGKQSIASTDYLKRGDDVINLGFNVAGVSNDTFRIKGANRPLVFYRSADKEATASIDLFYPRSAIHDGEKIAGKIIFVYGYVDITSGKRWGWIPLDALKLKS